MESWLFLCHKCGLFIWFGMHFERLSNPAVSFFVSSFSNRPPNTFRHLSLRYWSTSGLSPSWSLSFTPQGSSPVHHKPIRCYEGHAGVERWAALLPPVPPASSAGQGPRVAAPLGHPSRAAPAAPPNGRAVAGHAVQGTVPWLPLAPPAESTREVFGRGTGQTRAGQRRAQPPGPGRGDRAGGRGCAGPGRGGEGGTAGRWSRLRWRLRGCRAQGAHGSGSPAPPGAARRQLGLSRGAAAAGACCSRRQVKGRGSFSATPVRCSRSSASPDEGPVPCQGCRLRLGSTPPSRCPGTRGDAGWGHLREGAPLPPLPPGFLGREGVRERRGSPGAGCASFSGPKCPPVDSNAGKRAGGRLLGSPSQLNSPPW